MTPKFINLKQSINGIISGTVSLNAAAKTLWDGPVASDIAALKTVKVADLATLLVNNSNDFTQVLKGNMKLTDQGLSATSEPDKPTFRILHLFFNLLYSGKLKTTGGTDAFATVYNDIGGDYLPSVTQSVDSLGVKKELLISKSTLINKFPDVLANKLVSQSYSVTGSANIDAVSQNTPYIGLDFGISYTPLYQQLFVYEGVNFYFVPVNKDALLKTFGKFFSGQSFLKRFSVHIGLTQSLINAENKNYSPLIKDIGSLMVGAGLRFSRILRLNYGTILFYEKNPNPLVSKKDFKSMYTFSLTCDINIAKAFGGITSRLGIK